MQNYGIINILIGRKNIFERGVYKMLTAIENAKKLVTTPEWPRPINNFPKDSDCNCWGFALDGMKILALQERTYYSENKGLDKKIFDFLKSVGLNPRRISKSEEKTPDEFVFLFYIYTYKFFNVRTEDYGTKSECHAARIELDGTVVEKAGSDAEPVITSLEEIKERIFKQDKVQVEPIMFAVRKPQ